MAVSFYYPSGATPLDPDEAAGLIPRHLTTQAELNEWESANIFKAQQWLYTRLRKDVLSEEFVINLHELMFGQTWHWAGKFRRSDKNIGCDWLHIGVRLRDLLTDAKYWLEHKTFTIEETAARFHHRLVAIHCFFNGNGRHARMMADALLREKGAKPFTWGDTDLVNVTDARRQYLLALREADKGDMTSLLKFVRN